MKLADKKMDLLLAAEKVISVKGFEESTVSEIAGEAGVADSTIYKYFQGKEDLLFSLADWRMTEICESLSEHLQGIGDAPTQLKKFVWFHLRYNDTHQGFARILLLECIFSKGFNNSAAYKGVKKYSRILLTILKEGVADGSFGSNIDVYLAREIILGSLGCNVFMCAAIKETDASVSDLEDIISQFSAMLLPVKEKNSKLGDIITTAEKIFAEKGFAKTRISEIAQLAGVSEATIYENFETKEALLFSISEKRLNAYMKDIPQLYCITSPLRKLRRFIKWVFQRFFSNRDFMVLFLIEIQLSFRYSKSNAFTWFLKQIQSVEGIIKEGKLDGSFHPNVNGRVFRNMLLGTLNNMTLVWFILEGHRKVEILSEIEKVTDYLCASLVPAN